MNLSPLFKSALTRASNVINYQSVRWRRPRKPFWLGLAKSKMFVIREPKIIPTPEEEEVQNLIEKNYDVEYKSIMNFICSENPRLEKMNALGEKNHLTPNSVWDEKIRLSLKVNEEWNAESKRLGEEWKEKLLTEEAEKAKILVEENQKKESEKQERIDEIIRKEKVLSKTYITRENLDEAIENCLKNVAEFDFAIDLNGNKYYGRESLEKVKDPIEINESAVLAEEMTQKSEIVTERN